MKNSINFLTSVALVVGCGALAITGCNKTSATKEPVTLDEMNMAVSMLSMSAGVPRTVEELTNFPAFKGRPFSTPPAGKKFTIDRTVGQVVIVDQ